MVSNLCPANSPTPLPPVMIILKHTLSSLQRLVMASCCLWSSLAFTAPQPCCRLSGQPHLPCPALPSSYEPFAPALPSSPCLSTPQHLPIMRFFLHRSISSGHFKRVTEIWGQDTSNIPVTSSGVEISAWSHRGREMEIYSCSSWNSR